MSLLTKLEFMCTLILYVVLGPRHSIAVGSGPVVQCLPVVGELWVACDGTLHQLQKDRKSIKVMNKWMHHLFTTSSTLRLLSS